MIFRRKDNDGFGTPTVWSRLASPFTSVAKFFTRRMSRQDSIDADQSPVSQLIGWLTLPIRFLVGWLIFMVQSWTTSRSGAAFLKAIPALVGMGGLSIALLAADVIHNKSRQVGTNLAYFEFQLNNAPDHPEYAEIFAERLVDLQPDNLENRFRLGLVRDRKGDSVRALDIMSSLAPKDQVGMPKAHVWQAEQYADQLKAGEISDSTLVRKHLELAIEANPGQLNAHFELANLEIEELAQLDETTPDYQVKIESIIGHLTQICDAPFASEYVGIQLAALPRLLELLRDQGRQAEAKQRLQSELFRMDQLAINNPDGALRVRQTMVAAALKLNDYQQAIINLQEARKVARTDQARRLVQQMFSMVKLENAGDFKDMNDRLQYTQRLVLLCEAILLNPFDSKAGIEVIDFIAQSNEKKLDNITGISHEQVRMDWLTGIGSYYTDPDERKLSPRVRSVVHVLTGIQEISTGNVSGGKKYWKIAERQNENIHYVVNLLLQVIALQRPDEFSNVFDMISLAIELFPEQPRFYATRGVYLRRQKRYEEAITDLKHASDEDQESHLLYFYLVDCYQKLGDETNAQEYQALLDGILSRKNELLRKRAEEEIKRISEAENSL